MTRNSHYTILGMVLFLTSTSNTWCGEPIKCKDWNLPKVLSLSGAYNPVPARPYLYYLEKNNLVSQIASISGPQRERELITSFNKGVSSFGISPRKDYLAGITSSDSNKQTLFLIQIAKKSTETIASEEHHSFVWSPTEEKIFFTSYNGERTLIETLDILTQKRASLGELKGQYSIEDISPNNLWIALLGQKKTHDIVLFQTDVKKPFVLYSQTKIINPSILRFTKNSESLIFLSNHMTDTKQVVVQPLRHLLSLTPEKSQKLQEFILYSEIVKPGLAERDWQKSPVEYYKLDSSRRVLMLNRFQNGFSKIESYLLELDGTPKLRMVAPEPRQAYIQDIEVVINGNELQYFYSKSSLTSPSRIYTWKKGAAETLVTEPLKGQLPECFNGVQYTALPTDGANLEVYSVMPNTPNLSKAGVAFLWDPTKPFHPAFNKTMTAFALKGFPVAMISITPQKTFKFKPLPIAKDIATALIRVSSLYPTEKINFFGFAKGIEAAFFLRTAQNYPDTFSGLMLSNPILDLKTYFDHAPDSKKEEWLLHSVDYKDAENIKMLSPYYFFSGWKKTPLLNMTSKEDDKRPSKYYAQLKDFFKKHALEFEEYEFKNTPDQFEKMTQFLEKKHNEPQPQASKAK